MNKKLLPLVVKKHLTVAVQEARKNKYAVYSLRYGDDAEVIGYDVFKIRLSDPHPKSDEDYDKVEGYALDRDFGISAWSFSTKPKAMEKFYKLTGGVKHDD